MSWRQKQSAQLGKLVDDCVDHLSMSGLDVQAERFRETARLKLKPQNFTSNNSSERRSVNNLCDPRQRKLRFQACAHAGTRSDVLRYAYMVSVPRAEGGVGSGGIVHCSLRMAGMQLKGQE